jgi:hypothetical protein
MQLIQVLRLSKSFIAVLTGVSKLVKLKAISVVATSSQIMGKEIVTNVAFVIGRVGQRV